MSLCLGHIFLLYIRKERGQERRKRKTREKKKRRPRPSEVIKWSCNQAEGRLCSRYVSPANPSRSIGENTCTALKCAALSMQRSPAYLPECKNIWQSRSKENICTAAQGQVLMKVVTVPKNKAALLMQRLLRPY